MFWELAVLLPLGIASNCLIPMPFEPLLVTQATRFPEAALSLALWGSMCAAIGEFLDVKFMAALGHRFPQRRIPAFLQRGGNSFYWVSGLVAFSPIPITLLRAAAYWRRPHAGAFAFAVALGRLPRYLLIAWAWHSTGARGFALSFVG